MYFLHVRNRRGDSYLEIVCHNSGGVWKDFVNCTQLTVRYASLTQGVPAFYANLDSVLVRTEKYPDLFGTLKKKMVEMVGAQCEHAVPVVTGM